jgi:hypothetical protein
MARTKQTMRAGSVDTEAGIPRLPEYKGLEGYRTYDTKAPRFIPERTGPGTSRPASTVANTARAVTIIGGSNDSDKGGR